MNKNRNGIRKKRTLGFLSFFFFFPLNYFKLAKFSRLFLGGQINHVFFQPFVIAMPVQAKTLPAYWQMFMTVL